MSPKPTCEVCLETFHYSEVSELTVELDMNGHDAPDICMWCEAHIQRLEADLSSAQIGEPEFNYDDPADAYAFPGGI